MLTYAAIETIANTVTPAGTFATPEAEPEFAKKVRLASVLLRANNPITYEDIRRATPGVYYRIALRIAAARFPNLSFTETDATGATSFTNNSSNINFQWLEDDIIAMLTPQGAAAGTAVTDTRLGSFSGAIEWSASKLVAAHVLRNIPLNNTSLKFVDVANNLEEQALEDVDRVIQIENGTSGSTTANNASNEDDKGQATICIAHSLDLTTIPEAGFDVPDPGSSPQTFTGTVSFNDVEVVNTLSVDVGETGICYFYMTGQAIMADQDLITSRTYASNSGDPQNSRSVSYKIEKAFEVVNDSSTINIDELITLLADEINTETLNIVNSSIANILTAPERGNTRTTATTVVKRDLYPDTLTNKNRQGLFNLYHRINKLRFDVRRYSNKSDTEMLTIAFYTVPTIEWNTYQTTPTPENARILRSSGTLGINGLVFGDSDLYTNLGNRVPYSALLNVEKGNVAAVSVLDSGASPDTADSLGDADASNIIDTFYFSYDPDDTPFNPLPFSSDLVLRITTTSYLQSIPLDITVDLTTVPFTDPSTTLPIGEQIAGRVVDAIYQYTRDSNLNVDTTDNANVLGVLLGNYERIATVVNSTNLTATEVPLEEYIDDVEQTRFSPVDVSSTPSPSAVKDNKAGRVQIVSFRYRDEEYRMIVEVLSIPTNLWIATGNYILRRTQWVLGRRRSITAETRVLTSSTAVANQTTAEELASVNASVGKVEASKSLLLQKVYDKRRLLKEAQKNFPTQWHSQT